MARVDISQGQRVRSGPWHLHVLGTPRDLSGRPVAAESIAHDLATRNRLPVTTLDGNFAIVAHCDNEIHVATDPVASFPILVSADLVTDDWARMPGGPLDDRAVSECINTSHLVGTMTLQQAVEQVPGGSYWIGDRRERYWRFEPRTWGAKAGHDDLVTALRAAIAAYTGKRVLLPLSGGWDSRLLFALLLEAGIDFDTYSIGGDLAAGTDAGIARHISQQYGKSFHRVGTGARLLDATTDHLIIRTGGAYPDFAPYTGQAGQLAALAERYDVMLRGDEAFGWRYTSLTQRDVKHLLNIDWSGTFDQGDCSGRD